jgi:hypothetical protein
MIWKPAIQVGGSFYPPSGRHLKTMMHLSRAEGQTGATAIERPRAECGPHSSLRRSRRTGRCVHFSGRDDA